MIKLRFIFSIIAAFMTISNLNAQVIENQLNEELYKTRIKLVDEFFNRFNGNEYRPDLKKTDKNYRLKNIIVLFNGKMFKSFQDSDFIKAKAFAQKVIDDSVKIKYNDSTWIAKAVCSGKLKGKPVEFTIYLKIENRRANLYKWVIAKAEGKVFELKPSFEKESIILKPDDHETNFMSLHRITTEKDDYILNYKQKTFQVDETSVFYSLVYNGLLDIDYVKNLSFIFFQVPGYRFTVSHFERDTFNAGWLISSLEKITEKEKNDYLNYISDK